MIVYDNELRLFTSSSKSKKDSRESQLEKYYKNLRNKGLSHDKAIKKLKNKHVYQNYAASVPLAASVYGINKLTGGPYPIATGAAAGAAIIGTGLINSHELNRINKKYKK